MDRPLRVEYPGAFYHVINRGNAGENIFKSLRDREKFIDYLETASSRYSIRIHTYCLMTNHYHLLVETPEANLSRTIQWINVSYAVYFNVKRQRRGHLFQGRFKALIRGRWKIRENRQWAALSLAAWISLIGLKRSFFHLSKISKRSRN